MTRQADGTALDQIVELVANHGSEAMAEAFACLLEIGMKLEREQVSLREVAARSWDPRCTRPVGEGASEPAMIHSYCLGRVEGNRPTNRIFARPG